MRNGPLFAVPRREEEIVCWTISSDERPPPRPLPGTRHTERRPREAAGGRSHRFHSTGMAIRVRLSHHGVQGSRRPVVLHLVVLVGTTKGRAAAVAAEVAADLVEAGTTVDVVSMEQADASVVVGADALVVCTSTFGAGGVPANARGFLERLEAGAIPCAGKPVGYIGLGDRSFRDTYNGGWKTMARGFAARGAVGVGEPLLFDAADARPPAEAIRRRRERIAAWTATFRTLLAAASG